MARTKQRRTYLPYTTVYTRALYTVLILPSYSRYSFTDPKRIAGWVSPGPGCKEQCLSVSVPQKLDIWCRDNPGVTQVTDGEQIPDQKVKDKITKNENVKSFFDHILAKSGPIYIQLRAKRFWIHFYTSSKNGKCLPIWALESVTMIASALSTALTIYPCQIRVHQRWQSKLQLPTARKKEWRPATAGSSLPCCYLSTLWYTLL